MNSKWHVFKNNKNELVGTSSFPEHIFQILTSVKLNIVNASQMNIYMSFSEGFYQIRT